MHSFSCHDDIIAFVRSSALGMVPIYVMPYAPERRGPTDAARLTSAVHRMAAMPNGAVLLLGVMPDKRIEGVETSAVDAARATLAKMNVATFEFFLASVSARAIVLLHIGPQSLPALAATDDLDVVISWWAYTPETRVAQKIALTSPNRGEHDWDVTTPLVAVGALDDREGRPVPTVAGALVLGDDPCAELPGAAIVLDRGRGDELVRGPTLALIASVANALTVNDVARELLVNAFLHRDWSSMWRRTPVRIIVRHTRIEVVSPGAPVPADEPLRNPALVDLAWRAGWCSARRCGLLAVQKQGALDISAFGTFARVRWTRGAAQSSMVVRRPEAPRREVPRPAVEVAPSVPSARSLNAREQQVIDLLVAASEPLARQRIQDGLGCSRTSARNALDGLVEKGLVERVADNARSPDQGYLLIRAAYQTIGGPTG